MPTFHATSGIASTTLGAIVGDIPNPYATTGVVSAGDRFITENITAGEPGEFGLLGEMAVEFWYEPVSVTTAGLPDVLLAGPDTASVNAQWWFGLNSGGTVSFNLRNPADSATVGATSSVSILPGVFSHIVGVYDGANIRIYINGAAAGNTAYTGQIPAVNGTSFMYIGDAAGVLGSGTWWDELALYRHQLTAARVLAHYTAGVNRGRRTDLPGARIGAILDTISSPAPRSIQAGSRSVIETYYNGDSALSKIEQAEAAENVDALFFCARDGTLTFLAADHRSAAPYNTVQATFGDAGGSELPYVDLDLDYSDSFIVNEWTLTKSQRGASGGEGQVASDATSISKYFKRPRAVSDVPVTSDAAALAIANALLPKYKDPMVRITSISFTTDVPDVTEAVFRRDIGDKIRVLRTPPGGGSRIDQSLWIQKIEVDGDNSGASWRVRFGVSPL